MPFKLFSTDSFGGANARACTAVDARRAVYNVDVAGRDSLNGAFVNTGTACGTQIGVDFVSHYFSVFGYNGGKNSAS
jgi:hypothetical protein